MSRVGKRQIKVPSGVKVNISGREVVVENSGKKLSYEVPEGISARLDDGIIEVARREDTRNLRSLHGMARTIIANMITGVTEGFRKNLELVGRGKRASVQGKKLVLELGFSHPVDFPLPRDIEAKVEKNVIEISGIDKQQVGEVAAEIRDIQPPEPYKGAGIRYQGEHVKKKAGKTAVGGGFTGTGK